MTHNDGDNKPPEPESKDTPEVRFDFEGGFKGDISSSPIEMAKDDAAEWEKLLGFQEGDLAKMCDRLLTEEEKQQRAAKRALRRAEEARRKAEREAKLKIICEQAQTISICSGLCFSLVLCVLIYITTGWTLLTILGLVLGKLASLPLYHFLVSRKRRALDET
jgi:hypothetical protein